MNNLIGDPVKKTNVIIGAMATFDSIQKGELLVYRKFTKEGTIETFAKVISCSSLNRTALIDVGMQVPIEVTEKNLVQFFKINNKRTLKYEK